MSENWCVGCGLYIGNELLNSSRQLTYIKYSKKYALCSVCQGKVSDEYKEILRKYVLKVQELNYRAARLQPIYKNGLKADLTLEQWFAAVCYWDYSCSICKTKQSEISKLCGDHWINLTGSKIGTTCTNIIPLCKSCNNSKGHGSPGYWLVKKFGYEQAIAIESEIEAFFVWILQPRTWIADDKFPYLVKVDKAAKKR